MNADTKHNNVMVAIQMINKAMNELEKVARDDGERGKDIAHHLQDLNDNILWLQEWLLWLESELEPTE